MSALLNSHNTLPCSMQGLSNTCMRGYRSTLSTLLILLLPEFMAQLLLSSVSAHSHTATGSCVIILDSRRLKYHLHKMRSDESPQHCLGFVLSGPINIFEECVCGEGKRTLLSTIHVYNCSAQLEGWNTNDFHTKNWKAISVTFNFVKVLRWVSKRIKMLSDAVVVGTRHNIDKHQDIQKREKGQWLTVKEDYFLMLNFYHIKD